MANIEGKTEKETISCKEEDVLRFPNAVKGNELSYLIFLLARTHRGMASELLRPLNLYPGQELLLMQLWDRDGQSQIELICRLGLDASTVTKMVQRLEAQGHITRTPSSKDKRVMQVNLTSTGKKLRADVEKMWTSLNSAVTQILDVAEQEQISALLKKIVLGMQKGVK
ncbi:MarR family winged helix-turn-helix transcriptional regulator [Legionella bozemanae]|uniref:MarR family transporter transcriptional regulator n=1 Tax=Legionella bozemanae TaxID=447 RepID=A0A0W0RF57_LEGBO|nr:MarR family transcriptional regulator [Legionella bozemanae]KTC69621.1 MarR family transporter transcriptional regulator [Legionella bozemanae]STO33105.1 Organic hydroperoxide resistance transcriptional regulator [Legionella bozemanae]